MEHELPASITSRVAKAALPDKAILTKDARNTLNTAASMFALYLGTAAQESASQNKRQTIVLRDVMQALKEIDLESFQEPVEECMRAVKQEMAEKKAKKMAAQKEQNVSQDGEPEKEEEVSEGAEDDDIDAGLSVEEEIEDNEGRTEAEEIALEEKNDQKIDSGEVPMEVDSQALVEPVQDSVLTTTEAEEKAEVDPLVNENNEPPVEKAAEASPKNEN